MAKIKTTTLPDSYSEVRKVSYALGERRDCAVVAVSLACNVSYELAHQTLAAEGRRSNRGTMNAITVAAVKRLGFTIRYVDQMREIWPRIPAPHRYVLKNLTSHHPRRFPGSFDPSKVYLCRSNGHIWCVKDGVSQDWSMNRALRIIDIWEVSK